MSDSTPEETPATQDPSAAKPANPPLPPPTDPRLQRAQALWEVGDVLTTRNLIDSVEGEELSDTDQAHFQRLQTATSWDPVHVWVGLVLLVIWASLMVLTQ